MTLNNKKITCDSVQIPMQGQSTKPEFCKEIATHSKKFKYNDNIYHYCEQHYKEVED